MTYKRYPQFKVGDRVKYSREFLRNTGQFTGWAPFAVGTVVDVKPFGHPRDGLNRQVVDVDFGPDYGVISIINGNLVRTDKVHLEPA